MIKEKEFNRKSSLDQAGRRIVKESGLSPSEEQAIASSPFLYARIRAHVAGQLEQQETEGFWSNLSGAATKALPAMGLAAAVSFGLFLYMNGNKSSDPSFSVDAYVGANESGMDNLLFAEKRPLTTDEILSTIVSKDEREAAR